MIPSKNKVSVEKTNMVKGGNFKTILVHPYKTFGPSCFVRAFVQIILNEIQAQLNQNATNDCSFDFRVLHIDNLFCPFKF